jgi:hypothetical protein
MPATPVSDSTFTNALIDKAEREADMEVTQGESADSADMTALPGAYTEQGRHLRKKFQLQQKLKARKQAQKQAKTELTDQEKEEAARVASEKLHEIEKDLADQNKPKEPKKQVKVGEKMLLTTEATMTSKESAKLQARIGSGKSSKVRAFFKEQGRKMVIGDDEVKPDEVVTFSGCQNCEYTLTATCTKVFVEDCKDIVLKIAGKVITHTIEVDACERMNLLVSSKVGTLHVERCKKTNVVVADKALFPKDAHMVWAGCFMLRFQVGDATIHCDFGLTQKLDRTIHIERTQFKVWMNKLGRLTCDKVIRLKNGFPSTKREDNEHLRREEGKLEELAKRMGVNVHRKQDAVGGRVKPNAKCPCGSGKKYKKCCNTGELRINMSQQQQQQCGECKATSSDAAVGHQQ